MAEDKFKVDRIDVDKEGLAHDMKGQMPDFYSETVFDFPDEDRAVYSSSEKTTSSEIVRDYGSPSESYEPAEENYSYSENYEKQTSEEKEESSEEVVEKQPVEEAPVEQVPVEGAHPVESHPVEMPREGGQPTAGNKPAMIDPRAPKDKPKTDMPTTGDKPNTGGGDGKAAALSAAANALNNKKGKDQQKGEMPDEQEEKSPLDEAKEKKKKEEENNANTINNAADVAIASKNPYAMAAGGIIKAADKITGGKSTQMLGKVMRASNKTAPGGRSIQKASNYLAESGAGDKIGTAASMSSGGAGGAGAAEKGAKAAEAGDKAKKASEAGNKAKQAKQSGDKAKSASDKTKKAGGNSGGKGGSGQSSGSDGVGNKFDDFVKDAIKHFFMRHPLAIIVLGVVLLLFLLLLLDDDFMHGAGGNGKYCSYELNGVTSTGTVKLDNVQVELINCDGKADNYTVLETIDFEKYVVGVALAEVSWRKDAPEYFKAAIVAARGFSLKRNSGMCPSNPDGCFYGYNAETGKIRMRACTNDQVYCDIDKPCYHVLRSGQPTIYGPEAEGMSGATVWKGQLDEATKAEILAAAAEVRGKVLVDDQGNVVNTNYVNTDQQHWYELATQGKNYEEILVEHYSSQNAKGMNSAVCSNYGNIDYGNYELSSEGDTILNERLDKFLEKKGTSLEAFNKLIESNVEKNGYGTRAGVVAAGVTLIAELGNNYDVKVPYFLSGGHHDGVRTGALGYWGSGYEDDGRRCIYSGYGNVYTVCGLDCSGFVPWAIKNGGFQMGVRLAGDFYTLDGARKVSLSSSNAVLEPGDLLESSGHIVLVVGVDENTKQYICAEAMGKEAGVLFNRRSFADSGYWGVKMDGYYDKYSLKGK